MTQFEINISRGQKGVMKHDQSIVYSLGVAQSVALFRSHLVI
jgi:hypothetical protein